MSQKPNDLSLEEKIDYIYEIAFRDGRDKTFDRIWKWFWRAVLVISLGYIYFHPDYLVNSIKEQTAQIMPKGLEMIPENR